MLAVLLVFASIATQIADQLAHDAFNVGEYFGYFTIQSSLMNVVVLLVGGSFALRVRQDAELLTRLRMCVLAGLRQCVPLGLGRLRPGAPQSHGV